MHNSASGSMRRMLAKDFLRNRGVYAMLFLVLLYYALFHYAPMYGVQIAFKDYKVSRGIWGSDWVGFKHFDDFLDSYYAGRLIVNTFRLSALSIAFAFPFPILLAFLFNELRGQRFKRVAQTAAYFPHFISLVVVCGMLRMLLSGRGPVNAMLEGFSLPQTEFLMSARWFPAIYIVSGIWQDAGWGSIIYLAALCGIDNALFDAAEIDGAGRFRRVLHVSLPGILPTVSTMLILRLGSVLNVGSEKIILLYNPSTYATADVISTYVYRKGLLDAQYSASAAVGLLVSAVNLVFLTAANRASRALAENSLW